jgi:hypothetical protein
LIMRRLSTSYVAAFVATIVTLFIASACSQQPLSVSTIEPVTSTLDDSGNELTSNQAVDETSRNNSTQGDAQTTPPPDPTATATQEDKQTIDTLDPTATTTDADIETIIDGILAELLKDALKNLRDLEEEVEADMALLADDKQALIGVGE